jgi:hypothetical protein
VIDPHDRPTSPASPVSGLASHGLRSLAARLAVTKNRQRRADSGDRRPAATSNGRSVMRSERARREPRLRWPDDAHAPPSDFAPSWSNAQLRASHVPQRGDTWDVVSAFALSYDGNAYWDGLGALAHDSTQQWTRHHVLPQGLHELRASLFHEQRRWHHFGSEPRGRSAEYVWALLDAIAAQVSTH